MDIRNKSTGYFTLAVRYINLFCDDIHALSIAAAFCMYIMMNERYGIFSHILNALCLYYECRIVHCFFQINV